MNRIMVLLALGCAVSLDIAPRVRVDFDHGSRFSGYKTYRWLKSGETQGSAAQLPDAQFPNQLMQERIVGFVEEALAAKCLKRVETGGDLLIGYRVNVTEQQQFTTVGDGWGWGWGSGISTTTTQTILIGKLVIDMVDPHQKQLVFQGISTHEISSRPERNTRRLRRAVNEIFEKYPPQL